MNDGYFFQRDEAAADHRVEREKESIYLFFAVNNFDYERQVH